jgi:hypothetical protein
MDSKKPNRRGFLRGGAVAAGLAAGGGRRANGQTQGMPVKKIDELIAYGDRSRFVTSVRVPVAERHSPDEFGLTFHVLTPLRIRTGSSRLLRSTIRRLIGAPMFLTSTLRSIV